MINFIGFTFVFALCAVFGLMIFGVWIWSIVDLIKSSLKTTDKILWLLLILVFNIIGSIIYFLAKEEVTIDKSKKQLKRSSENRVIFGVCGGIAEHFDSDPTIIRLLWVILAIFSVGTGVLLYLIAAIIMPGDGKKKTSSGKVIAISLAAVFIILILCTTLITIVTISQYTNKGSMSKSIQVVEGYDRAEIIVRDHIMTNSNYINYQGGKIVCNTYIKMDGEICDNYRDPYGINLPSNECYRIQCKFNANVPGIKGFIVESTLVDDNIKELSFVKVLKPNITTIMTPEECESAGYEVLYPELKGGPVQCQTDKETINLTTGEMLEPICRDLCGDGICQDSACMGEGCPCPEDQNTCPHDCLNYFNHE